MRRCSRQPAEALEYDVVGQSIGLLDEPVRWQTQEYAPPLPPEPVEVVRLRLPIAAYGTDVPLSDFETKE